MEIDTQASVRLVDERQKYPNLSGTISAPSPIELYDKLVQVLAPLWQDVYSSTSVRDDNTWGEKLFYEYPQEAIRAVLVVFLVRRKPAGSNGADIVVSTSQIRFQGLSTTDDMLDGLFKKSIGYGSDEGWERARGAMQDNNSYGPDGRLGLELGKGYFIIFRRDPTWPIPELILSSAKSPIVPAVALIPAGPFWLGSFCWETLFTCSPSLSDADVPAFVQ